MNADRALDQVYERTMAVLGRTPGVDSDLEPGITPNGTDGLRRLLCGLVEPEDMDRIIEATNTAAHNMTLVLCGGEVSPVMFAATLKGALAQQLLLGLLLGGRS